MAWTTIFTPPQPITTFNNGWQVGGGRFEVPSSLLTAAPGATLVRVTIKTYSTTSSGNIDDCWIGESGGLTDRWAFDGNQVQLKFSGAVNKTGITGAQTIVTDAATFSYNPAKTLIVAMHFSGTELDLVADSNTLDTTCTFDYYVSGTSTSSQTDPAMSNPNNNGDVGIALIEMGSAGSSGDPPSNINVSYYKSCSYRDYTVAPLNPNLYPPTAPALPEVNSQLGIPFNTGSYRDTVNYDGGSSAFLPNIIQGLVNSQLGVPFSGLNYRDTINYDGGSSAFLPNIIQGLVNSQLGVPFNGLNYRDSFFDGSAFLPNIIQGTVQSLFGVSFNGLNYRDYQGWTRNPGLFQIATVQPFFNPLAPVSFNSGAYRDSSVAPENPNLYPAAAQEYGISVNIYSHTSLSYRDYAPPPGNPNLYQPPAPFFNALAPVPFSSGSYRDNFLVETAFPTTIGATADYGTSVNRYRFSDLSYRDYYIQPVNVSLYTTSALPFLGLSLPVPFNANRYLDTRNYNDSSNAFLPFIIQSPVQSLLGAPFNPLSYRDSFFDGSAFLPNTIQNPVQSLLGVSFNGLNYREYLTGENNPSLFPIVSVTPFFNSLASVPFNSVSYRDTAYSKNPAAFLPGVIQGQVQSQLGVPFSGLNYRDTENVGDNNGILPNIAQCPVQSLFGVSFNGLSYRDYPGWTRNPGLFPVVSVSPFFNPLAAVPFSSVSYRDTGNVDTSAFLPATIQGQVQSQLGAPFNALAYRDPANVGDNAFLPGTIQTPASTFLNVGENAAPFNTKAYRDSYTFQISYGLFPPPPSGPFPFVSSQLGAPFNAVSFRDPANVGDNAFLPGTIQGQTQSLLGSQFSGLGYRDSFTALRNPSLYAPVVGGAPFSPPLFTAIFNALAYRDSAETLRNPSLYPAAAVTSPFVPPISQAAFNALAYRDAANVGDNAFLPSVIQGKVQALLGSPFNAARYQDTAGYPPNAFLPRLIQPSVRALLGIPFTDRSYRDSFFDGTAFLPNTIQGKVQSQLGVPFSPTSYRDSFVVPNPGVLYPPPTARPFFNQSVTARFDPLFYADQSLCTRTETNNIILCANKNAVIRIALQDGFGNWLQPPFEPGYFSIFRGNQTVLERTTEPPGQRNYPLHVFTPMPFLNPPQMVRFNPLSYADNTSFMGNK
jgi:hypothetical protein